VFCGVVLVSQQHAVRVVRHLDIHSGNEDIHTALRIIIHKIESTTFVKTVLLRNCSAPLQFYAKANALLIGRTTNATLLLVLTGMYVFIIIMEQ
jgi:hypothetical protein